MTMPQAAIPPFVTNAGDAQIAAILGAMRAIAGATPSEADRRALASAARYMFGVQNPDLDRTTTPDMLATVLAGTPLSENALKFIAVMAFVDGTLDKAKIAAVLRYAQALGLHERFVDEIAEAAAGHVQEALADMTRANMLSIAGKAASDADETKWLLPYDAAPDPALAERFEALGAYPSDSFGLAFYRQYKDNKYAFPGERKALNIAFAVPHDSVHVLTGYNTTPRGELLASTFTAGMHPHYPMAGHILPVIFSWHLGIEINAVAKDARGALDPSEFWRAWAAGAASPTDTFAAGWDFWTYANEPIAQMRARLGIPPQGLDG